MVSIISLQTNGIGSCHNMRDRLRRHYYCLTHDQHHSPKLQRSWNKYGENAFEVIVLKSLEETSDDMFTIEEQFIKAFDSKDNGYNILDVCKHVGTFKLSKESADKAGKTHSKAVIAVDRYTSKFYKRYSSLTEAEVPVIYGIHNIITNKWHRKLSQYA